MNDLAKRKLRRSLGLFAIIAYGVGDILGAGIYVLVGKIAGIAGPASWFAFLIALAVASLTALSYAELGRRFPRSGGESLFCQNAFRSPALGLWIGWLVLSSGIVSLATVSRAFAGYLLEVFAATPSATLQIILMFLFLAILGLINFRGIRQSSRANIACTLIELGGLLLVIAVGVAFLARTDPAPQTAEIGIATWPSWSAIGQAAAVAFFAFIGFEDMVNVSEEIKSPKRNLPIAIIAATLIAGVVYILVVWVATNVVSPVELGSSTAPLSTVMSRAAPAIPPWSFTIVALFAVSNTALLNFIMASRLFYGMSQQGLVPVWLGRVHSENQTPHYAIVFVFIVALGLAISGSVVYLASTTSVLLLSVFFCVNVSLVVVKMREPLDHGFRIPLIVPVVAAVSSVALICFVALPSIFAGAMVAALGFAIVLVGRFNYSESAGQNQ